MRLALLVCFAVMPPDVREVSDFPTLFPFPWGYAPMSIGRDYQPVGHSRHRTSGGPVESRLLGSFLKLF